MEKVVILVTSAIVVFIASVLFECLTLLFAGKFSFKLINFMLHTKAFWEEYCIAYFLGIAILMCSSCAVLNRPDNVHQEIEENNQQWDSIYKVIDLRNMK